MPAAYAYHIIKNNPFTDGNKRIGLLVALTFLERNGLTITASNEDLYKIALDIAQSAISKEEIAQFFKQYTSKKQLSNP